MIKPYKHRTLLLFICAVSLFIMYYPDENPFVHSWYSILTLPLLLLLAVYVLYKEIPYIYNKQKEEKENKAKISDNKKPWE